MVASVCVLIGLTACANDRTRSAEGQRTVYVTLPVLASVVDEIAAPVLQVESMLGAGQSAHTFEPLPSVVRKASRAALVVFGAEHVDDWALHVSGVPRVSLISLLPDSLKIRVARDDHSIDPHFWTDPVAVRAILGPLAATLCNVAPDDCGVFNDNARRFDMQLDSLHQRLALELQPVRGARFAFTHSFLRYFFKRYDLEAAEVIGGADGLETSPRRIARLAKAVREEHVTALLVESRESMTAARILAAEINVPLVILDIVGGEDLRGSYGDLVHNLSGQIARTVRESNRH